MSSLEACMRKVPGLTAADKEAVRALRDDIYGAGDVTRNAANVQAVEEYVGILDMERENIISQVEKSGGVLADKRLSPSKFTQEVAENLEAETKKFPQKSAIRVPLEPSQKGKDLIDERTYRSVEFLYPDFYRMHPKDVLAILHTYEPEIALEYATGFGILPKGARKLIPSNYNQERMTEIHEGVVEKDNFATDADPEFFYAGAGETIVQWIEKNETLPIRYKVEEVDAALVDALPDHPIAATVKWGAVNQAAVDAEPEAGTARRTLEQLSSDMPKHAALAAVPQSKLRDFIRYGMGTVEEYVRLNKRMDGWMNERIEEHAALAKDWLEYTHGKFFGVAKKAQKRGARILGELMHASSLAGVDVSSFTFPSAAAYKKMNKTKRAMWDKRRADYEILKPFWDKLGGEMGGKRVTYQKMVYEPSTTKPGEGRTVESGPPMEISEAQAIYLRVRDTYANQRTELIQNLEKRIMDSEADEASKVALIAHLRKTFETGKITPYFPLGRFGSHWAIAKDPQTGETIGFIKRESRKDRNEWVKQMRAMGFAAFQSEEKATDVTAMQSIDPQFVARVTELVSDQVMFDEAGNEIPGTKLSDDIWQMYLRTLPEMSARKAYIHREGRLGFTHDALRTFSDQTFHQTHQMGKLRFGYRMNQLVQDAFEDARLLESRADMIKNLKETNWRPKGFDPEATVHEVLNATVPEYMTLYAKYKKQAGSTSNEVHEPSAEKALKKIRTEAEHDGPWAIPLANEMQRRHAYNMNPKSASWATDLTALGFFWFLSTSPAAGILNLTQTAISAYPIMRAEFSGMGSGQALLKAAKEFATLPWMGTTTSAVQSYKNRLKNDSDSDTRGELAALEEFERIGTFSKTRTRELMGLAERGIRYSSQKERAMEFVGYVFHKTEEMNRVVTAMASYRLARKKLAGDSNYINDQERHDKAVLMAEDLVEMSHYDYTNTNRPRFMQGDKGRVVFLFRNYSLNMQYRLLRDFKDGMYEPMKRDTSIPVEDRKKARSRFLGIIGMTTLFAGVGGWPMFWAVEAMANSLFGDDDEPYDVKTAGRKLLFDATKEHIGEVWGEKVADAVMRGPWTAFTQADLSTRASLNNLWIRDVPENLRGKDLLLHLAGEGLGPIFGMGMNYAQGFEDIARGHTDRAAERFMPKFAADAMKTIRFATQGAQNYSQDIIMAPEEFSNYEKFIQFIGFSPAELTRRYEQNRAIKDMEAKLKRRHKFLLDTLFRAYNLQDRKLARQTLKDITEWNKVNPRYPISPQSIMQSAKTRQQYDMRTVGGIAVDKRLQYLQNELRFTRRPSQ